MRPAAVIALLLLLGVLALVQSISVSKESGVSPDQSANTQVTYTVSLSGADATTLSIDGGAAIAFSNSKTITLDGSQPHTFQVQQVMCQSGWECGTQVTDWSKGKRLVASQFTWTVPAGTTSTQTYTETYPEYETVCVAYDSEGSCTSYGEEFMGYYYQTYTQETFTPPCKPCNFTFQYSPQYRLVWNDNYSSVYLYQWLDSCSGLTLQPPSGYSALGHGDTVAGGAGVQYVFNGWTLDNSASAVNQVTMCAPHQVTATYLTQYLLQVSGACNELNPTGGGWFNSGETATISVDPQVPIPGWQGTVGARYVFDGWEQRPGGNVAFQTPSANVIMNQPQSYFARCRADFATPGFGGGTIIIIIVLGGLIIECRITRGRAPFCRIIGRIMGNPFPPQGPTQGGGPPTGGGLPSPNVTGNAKLTGTNGIQTQLKPGNLNQVGPGTTVDTTPKSFVRTPIPSASNSSSIIGQSSRVSWLDPTTKTMIPWLKFPASFQNFDPSSMLRLDFGKLMINWMEPSAGQGALIILPAGLIGVGASATMSRVLARVKGKHVLFEATPDGTSAAVTVLEGESGNETGVELWRTDDLSHVIEVHAGERMVIKAGQNPTEMKVDLAKDLVHRLEDPFGALQKWWKIPPMSDEINAALSNTS